jgi:hypothetical protein
VVWTELDVLEENIATIFRIEEQAKQETSRSRQQAELEKCCPNSYSGVDICKKQTNRHTLLLVDVIGSS